jgi:hypothetical protein
VLYLKRNSAVCQAFSEAESPLPFTLPVGVLTEGHRKGMLYRLYPREEANEHVRLDRWREESPSSTVKLDLEQAIECINDDKCMEVTLQHLHVRQRILGGNMRPKWQE